MERTVALGCLLLVFAVAITSGLRLVSVVSKPVAEVTTNSNSMMLATEKTVARTDRPFLPIFGEQVAPVATANAPQHRLPNMQLRGTIIIGETRHAFLTTSEGEIAVQEGMRLGNAAEIVRIKSNQIDVLFAGVVHTVDFPGPDLSPGVSTGQQQPRQEVSGLAPIAGIPRQVGFRMTQDEVLALLQDPRAHLTEFASK